ncbi:signal recognition particle receptor subunit alpha [Babesia gibsoni]|uniref:Signal recognition particle receptor subunit alpha n=1 Tax=Babesia gibsoni TaxID=33632 RepID=A0AAD8PG20_BABGI|nr:signal recognition particle receptor subunit alpha [Babesia gibsoni]
MIDFAAAVSHGGIVLWSHQFDHDFGGGDGRRTRELLNKLIKTVILEERGVDQHATVDGVNFKWNVMHPIGATMYVMYQGIQNIQSLNDLLLTTSDLFFKKVKKHHGVNYDWVTESIDFNFDEDFSSVLYGLSVSSSKSSPPTDAATQPNRHGTKGESTKKHEKTKRTWNIKDTVSKQDMDELDFSTDKDKEPRTDVTTRGVDDVPDENSSGGNKLLRFYRSAKGKIASILPFGGDASRSKDAADKGTSGLLDSFSNLVLKYAGNMVLDEAAIADPLKELRMRLNSKNVASDISTMICDSVSAGLVGMKTEALTSVAATVRQAVEDSVRRILTPKEPINLIQNITEANAKGDIYSVLFLGVNGVGKSTSLAKVAYLLKCNGFKVLLIACDTFRSGAVEQLKIHSEKLGVELFERGYGRDPAAICNEGMKYGRANDFNVVLVDTAGRMQDNEPLMAALSKLVQVNNPDLLLFVGEALVGNDAVDQLRKFNNAIQRISESNPDMAHRKIDGIILTKFDTVDDKVGAALSMCYITGQPIVFVGTGQTYINLSKLEIKDVVAALTK